MTRVLITGASGFVGRSVCEAALNLGTEVRGCYRSESSRKFVPKGVERFRIPSVDHMTDWSEALEGVGAVIHLAGRTHVMNEMDRDVLAIYREVNAAGTARLARMSADFGIRRFVYVSTTKVNGEETVDGPFTEEQDPQPEDAYAISKWESEQELRRIGAESDLEIVTLRSPLVYGRGVRANFLRLLQLVRKGVPLPFASVRNKRSLIYVKNLADAMLMSLKHPKVAGRTFLVSDGDDISTPELIRRIAYPMGCSPHMFRCPLSILRTVGRAVGRSREVGRLLTSLTIDSSRIRSETGWMPPYGMSQGLKETVEWFLANDAAEGEVSSELGSLGSV